ncbi:protein phosphatase 2C domain-containing protein [Aetokthonos hydrillicola Thurmond2011]|jgi:serine/threonine protein phosphatase PrpC|uniref:Protein phosphatase 2C domain-containing protein n=1 Tax=Aetokthonos hydrillicola Thurmond2011 TaxID=2712845 RepID=A0AAP5I531_9CYAN|nr:protein phosphatase 2C domain-containing protein [Aetokthonos hydrillicola]MBO3458306.1 serine/threonine protein phosphatase [Aetokthonos hydrillicola CCALA 1050]MDR9893907.1 protein phosphatase 2C domain-containing protein [Aetokthonos hydrillicola Thurmond2011]
MECSKCGGAIQEGDRFCEECGTSLSKPGCEKCGAGLEEIDADGFCANCGFRRRDNPPKDRVETVLSPNLAGITDRGLRHHRNEDYVACAQIDSKNAYVLVVCDGVSSSELPELAAKAAATSACRAVSAAIETQNFTSLEEVMQSAISAAMASVCAIPYTKGTNGDPPSTTIVASVVVDRSVTIGWLGDSRAYWISPNQSRQLTKDDSWLNDVITTGEMTEAEARKSPHAHAITRWLGEDAVNSEASIVNFDIPNSGYLLLCTDGFWNYTTDIAQIDALVKSDVDAVTVARSLVEFAVGSGGQDNISVAILCL